jgi:hypothetical protein
LLAPSADPQDLITSVFGDLSQYQGNGMDLVGRAILTPLNDEVDKLNNICMGQFPGQVRSRQRVALGGQITCSEGLLSFRAIGCTRKFVANPAAGWQLDRPCDAA